MKLRRNFDQIVINLILVVIAIFTFVPLLTLLTLSFKNIDQFNNQPMGLTFPLNFQNYAMAWKFMQDPLWHNIVVGLTAPALSISMASVTAFVLARFNFAGRPLLFGVLLLSLLVPNTILFVPLFQLIIQLGAQNTLWALILPYAANQALTIFVTHSFYKDMPSEMFDAAKMDGANVLDTFLYIALPLSAPILSAMAIFQVWLIWNDYAWPSLVANSNEARTAVTGLIYFNDFTRPEPGAGMAAAVLAALPMLVLFIFTMRTFVAGLTAGAIKE